MCMGIVLITYLTLNSKVLLFLKYLLRIKYFEVELIKLIQ
ncbi:MAG: Uncharacterised protein [Polaribacter sp. SA4-10]|nr:MAG: Uncharacterised protein [Polaribacter sp. SA4-10]